MSKETEAGCGAVGAPVECGVSRLVEKRKDDSVKTTTLSILLARRDALRALTYKTDAITAELERLYRLIEQEQWSASQ